MLTHQMLEILEHVAKMSIPYRRLHRNYMLKSYKPIFQSNPVALDVLYLLLQFRSHDSVSVEVLECYQSLLRNK